jgi:Uma2 family endonuclease
MASAELRNQTPPLETGDRLTRQEFERRYWAMPNVKKAELLEGVVYLPQPRNSHILHGGPHFDLVGWLGIYASQTQGAHGSVATSLRLDLDNEVQPDALLRLDPQLGGQCHPTEDDFLEGPPELIAEVATSEVSYDLGVKRHVYRRNGVKEYVVWRVLDRNIDWYILREGRYDLLPSDANGILRSEVYPGLWLDQTALLRSDGPALVRVAQEGLASPEHAAFVQRLRKLASGRNP